jgi:hypothetical protein
MIAITSIVFGDIFEYNGREYVFLAKTEEVIYAAQILSPEATSRVDSLFQLRMATGKMVKATIDSNVLYCYVMLKTEKFVGRCVHFANTGKDDFGLVMNKLAIELDPSDIEQIKEEIIRKNAIPIELKELVKSLAI